MTPLQQEILDVLRSAQTGKSNPPVPHFLTAYQILQRLPTQRDVLLATRPKPGEGAKAYWSAASEVQNALRGLRSQVDVDFIDTRGMAFVVDKREFRAGYPVVALYRLKRAAHPTQDSQWDVAEDTPPEEM